MAKSKSTQQQSTGINPAIAGLVGAGIGFVTGLFVERTQKVTERVESEAIKAGQKGKVALEQTKEKGKAALERGSQKLKEKMVLADEFLQRMKDGPTDPKWKRHPIDPEELDEYPLSESRSRVIKGNMFLIHTRDMSDGYLLDAFPGKEVGGHFVRLSPSARTDRWPTVQAAEAAAENKELLMKALKQHDKMISANPGPDSVEAAYRQEILDAFFQNSKIDKDQVINGDVSLEIILYPSLSAYEEEKAPINERSFSIDDIGELSKIKPGMVADVHAFDAEESEILDIVPVEITGQLVPKSGRKAANPAKKPTPTRSNKPVATKSNKNTAPKSNKKR